MIQYPQHKLDSWHDFFEHEQIKPTYIMKKYLAVAVSVLLAACTNQTEISNVNLQRDSLIAVINQRDSSLNDFMNSFVEVEHNLDSVAVKQNLISSNVSNMGEFKQTAKDRINAEIAAINKLMNENRQKIASLNGKLKSSNSKNEQLQKMVMALNEQLAAKDKELAALNFKLAEMNGQIVQLQISVDTLSSAVATQTTSLHTAYYVIGKSKDLQEAKIIDRTGGVLGIGRTSKLSPDVDNSKFTRVDLTQIGSIPIDSKNVKIITSHPVNSYNLDKDKGDVVKNIVITDPQKFWSASKYLVVVKD